MFGILVGAYVFTRATGLVIRRVMRRVARKSISAPDSVWRTRARRIDGESIEMTEQRRRIRTDAAARMINHLVSLVVWVVTTIVVFNLLDVNASYYVSSAGFLGVALAFGGQHKVNDYLAGLAVHFEDRYGVGDRITFDAASGDSVTAVVDHIGLFSTRLRDESSTLHVANAALGIVRNLSQEPATATIRVRSGGRDPDEVAATLRGLAGTADLTQVVFLGDIASHQPNTGEVEIDVHTLRPLDHRSSHTLVERAERALGVEPVGAPDDR